MFSHVADDMIKLSQWKEEGRGAASKDCVNKKSSSVLMTESGERLVLMKI